jgi:hypothetical protein
VADYEAAFKQKNTATKRDLDRPERPDQNTITE